MLEQPHRMQPEATTRITRGSGAALSDCGRYRWALWRRWAPGPRVLIVMLNPSTADALRDDATIRRCIGFARAWGFGALAVGNLFAFRTRSPRRLLAAQDPVGEENDRWLARLRRAAALTVAAWGNHGAWRGRDVAVRRRLRGAQILRLSAQGQPVHPLYLPATLRPRAWPRP